MFSFLSASANANHPQKFVDVYKTIDLNSN